jgi:competence protein ComGC
VSVSDLTGLVTAAGLLVTGIVSLLNYLLARHIAAQNDALKAQGIETHNLVNGQTEALISAAKTVSYKEGKTEGRIDRLEGQARENGGG